MRFGSSALSTVIAASLALGVMTSSTACSFRNEDINRVVDPYWRKSDFDPNTEWYVRTTIIDAPPNAPYVSIGDGDWLMLEKVKWEITQDMLIGWRTYPVVPGSEDEDFPGAEDTYRGEPVAMFPITDHFDIRREFDPGTGEESNVISENRDRLWFDRANIRVDWSRNMVNTYKFHIWLNQMFNTQAVVQNDVGDPKRYRFELDDQGKLDYFEVVTRTEVFTDIYSYYGFYGAGYAYDPASYMLDMRHSFMRVPKSDYVPLAMPPTVVLEDENGEEVRDANGLAVRIPINDRFGYFGTLGRATFDENFGMLQSGQIFNASRFNIWKKHKNADGSEIPYAQREPKAIEYYLNVEHPHSLLNGAKRVGAEWNRAFRDTVWKLQPDRYNGALDATGIPSDVPAMFVVKENSCNPANVKSFLGKLPSDLRAKVKEAAKRESYNDTVVAFDGSFESVETRFNHANDSDNDAPFTVRQNEETQSLHDLERICSALEYYTGGDVTLGIAKPQAADGEAIPEFHYERLGDTRYAMINGIVGDFQSGWLGLGPPYADPITGETISATANIALYMLDTYAASTAQWVGALNGETSPNDLTYGFDIDRYMKEKLLETNGLTSLKPTQEAKDRIASYFDAHNLHGRESLKEVPRGRAEARMRRIEGTELERQLITQDDLVMFGGLDPLAAKDATMDEAMLDRVSPIRGHNALDQFLDRKNLVQRMGMRAMDPPEMYQDFLIGRALELRDLPYAERFRILREEIYVAVTLHEVGHNTGLFHNMAATSDALNYGKKFWELQELPADLDDAFAILDASSDAQDQERAAKVQKCIDIVADANSGVAIPQDTTLTTQDCLSQTEGTYASIMDYHGGGWNTDFAGLGLYDLAATKFAYGQLLEVFNDGAIKPAALAQIEDGSRSMKRQIFLDGWKTIPTDVIDGFDKIHDRSYVKLDWTTSSTRQAPLANEVPYKFGYGAQLTPDEKPFDYGPDFQSNAKANMLRYYQGFFFSHFARDRMWDYFIGGEEGAINTDINVMFDFTEKMQWLFFFEATDPEFRGSAAEEDMLGATYTGLNFFGQVIGHPASGLHTTVQKLNVFGLLDEDPDNRTEDPTDIMMPWSPLDECTARQVAETNVNGVFQQPKPNHAASIIPLSEGRPFFLGLTDDYEEWYVTYVGSFWAKLYGLLLLGYNYAYFPRVDDVADPRAFDVSWYRLFPKEVTKIYHDVITENYQDLGPLVEVGDDNGDPTFTYRRRDVINADGSTPDYSGTQFKRVMPSIAANHQYYALTFANGYMSSNTDDQLDMAKTMKIALEGGNDDMTAFDNADPADVISVTHPISGLTLRALRVGDSPIAYDLLRRVQRFKERYELLDGCVKDLEDNDNNTNSQITESYCHCVSYYTDALTGDCTQQVIEPVGEGICTPYVLENRRDTAREALDDMFDYANNVRSYNYYFGN